jgi:ribosomal-protein-alanine N-acetyltransferase
MVMTWQLRPATAHDLDGLHALTQKPQVYRYLYDGVAPDHDLVNVRLVRGLKNQGTGGGLWFLESANHAYAGAFELRPEGDGRIAEASYFLDPDAWGQGLAVRMTWSIIQHAFAHLELDEIFAGADHGNDSSFRVMARLGMRFRRDVSYTLGPGREYIRSRHDPEPTPVPALIEIVPATS